MQQRVLALALLSLGTFSALAQNVGIGTATPGSRLTVNGSFAAGYTAVSTATYLVLDNDYYITWAGPAAGTLTLPTPTAVTKGRVYKIRNGTALFGLTLSPGGVLVDGQASLNIPAGSTVELIANGNTSGTAWEVVSLAPASATLATAGASSGTVGGAGGACLPAPAATGSFVAASPATSQTLAVTVNITAPGTYTIGTNTVNGLSFFASGYFAAPGVQTVPLYAHGTPITNGTFAYTVAFGSSLCSASVNVGPGAPVASFNCASITQTQSPSGPLVGGTAYTGTYTVPYTTGSGVAYSTTSQTVSGLLLTRTAGTYAAGGGNVVYTLSGTYTGPSNVPVIFTTAECGTTATYGDAIREALNSFGCFSCAAYDAAAVNTLVSITAGEYTAVRALSGMGVYATQPALMGTNASNYLTGPETMTQNFNTPVLPAANYPVALSLRVSSAAAPATMAGIVLKGSSTAENVGYADIVAGAATPNATTTPAVNTIYYFLFKRPTTLTANALNLGLYQSEGGQVGFTPTSGTSYHGAGNIANPNLSVAFTPLFQVLATPIRQW